MVNESFEAEISEKEQGKVECPECGKMFENKKDMKKHMDNEHDEMEEKLKQEERNNMEAIEKLQQELNSFKQELRSKELAEVKTKEDARIADLESKAKLTEQLQKEIQELRAKKTENESKDKTIGEVGMPTKEIHEISSNVIVGKDKEGLSRGTVITRERYPSHLKRLNRVY